ncbi:uncharacterized protein LOC125673012 [Ostrea edulis]|uniref:uncharacterized protein LOC125673012 n=1 Tax=Ostrea edulis TaxID=37623 RepID=UPI0024AF73CF|nr:uncharacterized protein LOC125673012 [Ostrea edulis]XP_056015214.1 uncharacterized protein LOC125673012 [Ostrea edulis]
MSYSGYGHVADSCPLSKTEFTAAATRLNCNVDKFGRNPYTCVPKLDLTALVEFCYNSTVAFYPKGHCLWVQNDGNLNSINCSQFTEGCPKDHYRGNELYKFPACHQINTEHRCFYANPSCPNQTRTFATKDGIIPTTLMNVLNTTTNITSTLTPPVEQGSTDVGVIIGSIVAVVFVLCILLALIFLRRRRKKKEYLSVSREDPEPVHWDKDPEQVEIVHDSELDDKNKDPEQVEIDEDPRLDQFNLSISLAFRSSFLCQLTIIMMK